MQTAYELAERDFIEAYSAHRNRNGLSKWVRRIFIAIMGVFTMVILFGFLVKPSLQAAKGLLPFFGLMVMWVAALWILPLWNTPRQFRKQPGARGPRTALFDSSGTHWRWNGGSSDIEWKNYVRAVEGKNLFLIYSSPACFNILPKRALGDEQVGPVRELLGKNVPLSK